MEFKADAIPAVGFDRIRKLVASSRSRVAEKGA
jgi:hypothetical protein